MVETLEAKGVTLRMLDLSIDTGADAPHHDRAIAQFERELMLARQRAGIARAKAAGRYKGRAPTAPAKKAQVLALKAEGIGPSEIARRLGIGRSAVYRCLR